MPSIFCHICCWSIQTCYLAFTFSMNQKFALEPKQKQNRAQKATTAKLQQSTNERFSSHCEKRSATGTVLEQRVTMKEWKSKTKNIKFAHFNNNYEKQLPSFHLMKVFFFNSLKCNLIPLNTQPQTSLYLKWISLRKKNIWKKLEKLRIQLIFKSESCSVSLQSVSMGKYRGNTKNRWKNDFMPILKHKIIIILKIYDVVTYNLNRESPIRNHSTIFSLSFSLSPYFSLSCCKHHFDQGLIDRLLFLWCIVLFSIEQKAFIPYVDNEFPRWLKCMSK